MPVDERKVRQVLRTQLLTVTGIPAAALRSFENRAFSPPNTDKLWVRDEIIKISEILVATNQLEFMAFYQVDVRIGTGQGTEEVDDLVKAIKDAFKPATSLQGTGPNVGVNIALDRAEASSPVTDPGWYFIPVRIKFRTYTTNT